MIRGRALTALPLPCLMLVTEPSLHLPQIVAHAVAGGVNVVQWRERRADGSPLTRTESLAMLSASRPALLLENIGTVFRGIHGSHLPEGRLTVEATRRILSPGDLVGRSVHSAASARAAAEEGADYLIAGTIFTSQSHPGIAPAGLGFLREVCAAVSVPVLAIGGITPQNLELCLEAGAAGVAVLSPIMRATDSKAAAEAYRAALDTAWKEKQ